MATPCERSKGNLIVIDNLTDKPYDQTVDVSSEENLPFDEDANCTDFSYNHGNMGALKYIVNAEESGEMVKEEISKRKLTPIQQGTIKRIPEHDFETKRNLNEVEDTGSNVVNQWLRSKGNLVIIDKITNKPFEHATDVSIEEKYRLDEDATSTDFSDEEYMDAIETTVKDNKNEEIINGFIANEGKGWPCTFL